MTWIRAYVAAKNGDFDRIVDIDYADKDFTRGQGESDRGVVRLLAAGEKKLKLKKGETAEYAELTFGEQQAHSG